MRSGRSSKRIGWVTASSLDAERATFRGLPPPVAMRVANIARWIDANDRGFHNELHRRDRRYDVVVFVKAMSDRHLEAAEPVQSAGARVVLDANANYYEVWGEYDVADTQPTDAQQREAEAMTRLADWVVADSSYLLGVVRKLNERGSWFPDNVDTSLFRPGRRAPGKDRPLRPVWPGRARTAKPRVPVREAAPHCP